MANPRIALIHALAESVEPSKRAFAELWPTAAIANLLEDSLSADLAKRGALDESFDARFLHLAHYMVHTGAQGILFTCSAFGRPIEAVKRALKIPVLKPNEAALEAALRAGKRIALLATFAPTLASMERELNDLAQAQGRALEIATRHVAGALEALKAGNTARHDALIAEAADAVGAVDALVLCQFSMARAATSIAPIPGRRVLTTPASAVLKLKSLVGR